MECFGVRRLQKSIDIFRLPFCAEFSPKNISLLKLFIFLSLFNIISVTDANEKIQLIPSKDRIFQFVGKSFFVSCKPIGKNVQRLMWTEPNTKQIISYSSRIHVEESVDKQKLGLYFNDIDMKDQGNYTCSANIDGKEVKKSFSLTVYKVSDFTGTHKQQFLEEGKNSTVKCNVDGDPAPKVRWTKDGHRILNFKKSKKYSKHPNNKDWLIVHNVTKEDAGKYKCQSIQSNVDISEIRFFNIEVKVKHKPFSHKNHKAESFSFLNGIVNLTCEAVAQPVANFTWKKDNVSLNNSEEYTIFTKNHSSILQISVKNESMFGDYYCSAQNELGIYTRVVTLEKGRKPSKPKAKITEIYQDGYKFQVNSQNLPDMPIIAYRVEYKERAEEWENAKFHEFDSGDSQEYRLNGLKPHTIYVLRTSAKNKAGYSDPSDPVAKKTAEFKAASGAITVHVCINVVLAILYCTFQLQELQQLLM